MPKEYDIREQKISKKVDVKKDNTKKTISKGTKPAVIAEKPSPDVLPGYPDRLWDKSETEQKGRINIEGKLLNSLYPIDTNTVMEAGIIIHVDHRVFNFLPEDFGTVEQRVEHIKAQVQSIVRSSAVVFRKELDLVITLDDVIVETDADTSPFISPFPEMRLEQVKDYWIRTPQLEARDRAAVMFLFGVNDEDLSILREHEEGALSGRAYLGSVCSKQHGYGYSLLHPLEIGHAISNWPTIHEFEEQGVFNMQETAHDGSPHYTFPTTKVFAHELGHILGGNHLWELADRPSEDDLQLPGIMGTGSILKPLTIHPLNKQLMKSVLNKTKRENSYNPRCLHNIDMVEPRINRLLVADEGRAGIPFELDAEINMLDFHENLDYIWHMMPATKILELPGENGETFYYDVGTSDNPHRVFGKQVTYTYERAGTYPPIGLYLAHASGEIDYTETATDIRIMSDPGVFTPDLWTTPIFRENDVELVEGIEQEFYIQIGDENRRHQKVIWDFGDSSDAIETWVAPQENNYYFRMLHTYAEPGDYEISVTIEHGDTILTRNDVYEIGIE